MGLPAVVGHLSKEGIEKEKERNRKERNTCISKIRKCTVTYNPV